METEREICILKARQIGMTWLSLGHALHEMLFHDYTEVLLFSKRDDEAIELLYTRLRGMHSRLPDWMQEETVRGSDNKHEWALANGSRAKAFPTTGGDSYTASIVIADEFDLVKDQSNFLGAVEPTIANGGQIILLSRSDKARPNSVFKNTYRAGKAGEIGYVAIFLPWWAHPERDMEWYRHQERTILKREGSKDQLYEQYPETDAQALAANSQDKRISAEWVDQCYEEMSPIPATQWGDGAPAYTNLKVYRLPEPDRSYVIGADPAEGNPNSDDSAFVVMDADSGEEVASFAAKLEPSGLAAAINDVGRWYNDADLMVERNNHGHAVLLWLKDNSPLKRLYGHDRKVGWLSSARGKQIVYADLATAARDSDITIHTGEVAFQVQSIEANTLRAPEGDHDDLADALAMANAGREQVEKKKQRRKRKATAGGRR